MKSLLAQFILRPVFTSALGIFILMLGLTGLMKMPLRFLPKTDQALIDINTIYPGANNQVVKCFVTNKIENAIVGVDGIDYMTSTSTTGTSEIKIYLLPDANTDATLTMIMEKVNAIQGDMPSQVKSPVIMKENKDNQAILILGFSSEKMERVVVSDYLRRVIAPQIESVDGVAHANVWGDEYVMQIWLNPDALTSYHLSPQDVVNALRQQNVLASPGKTRGNYFNYTLNATTALHTADDFNNLVIKIVNNVPIYLRDVGEARTGSKENDFNVYYNGKPTSMMGIVLLPESNPLTVVKNILHKLPQITKEMPSDLKMHVVLDRTTYISNSLNEVVKSLLESILIVIAVIFLFLGNIRAALIPAITIPLSLLGICFFMQLLGYSLNTITLLAMVLGVGLVVDDAIVVLENCVKHINQKISIIASTINATQELVIPIIAMTITLAAVYVPIGLTGGLIGQLFKEFAFTLAGSVMISGLLALTLSPMMAARLINMSQQQSKIVKLTEHVAHLGQQFYRKILLWIFQRRTWMIVVWLMILLLSIILYFFIPSELVPEENQGFLIAVGNAPTNASLAYLKHYSLQANDIFKKFNLIDDYATVISTSEGYASYLISRDEKHPRASILQIVKPLQNALSTIPGLELHVITPSILASSGPPIQFVLQSTKDPKELYQLAKALEAQAMQSGLFMFLFDDLNYDNPEATIVIDNHAAAALNVSMNNIADAISSLMSNQQVQQFSAQDQSYDVVIKTLANYQLNPEDLQNISIPTNQGSTIPLSSLAHLQYVVTPIALNQFQKMNSVAIAGAMLPGHSLSQGLSFLAKWSAQHLPADVIYDYAGSSRQFLQEGHRMLNIFGLAILVIFLVLSMQFESYRDSLIILLGSVPMALFAALLALKLGFGSINIYTQIGLLTLVGLISKHGILITRFANEIKQERLQQYLQGEQHRLDHSSVVIDNQSAVIEAAMMRLRPILMTTAAILFGMLPLITANGAGSESRHAIGVVISVGISIGTLLTLLVLPVVYTVFAQTTIFSPANVKTMNLEAIP